MMDKGRVPLALRWLGRVDYDEAHAVQRRLVDERIGGGGSDVVLALEHEPVLTLGKNARDRKSTRLNSSHVSESRMPSSA